MKILIVEDDLTTLEMIKGILSDYGNCDTALNGKEGINAFESAIENKDAYDLVCLDILMPEMDGQEMLKLIRDKEKDMGVGRDDEVKVIMVTTMDTADHVTEAYYKGGCTSYLIKPVDAKKLLGLLKAFGLVKD